MKNPVGSIVTLSVMDENDIGDMYINTTSIDEVEQDTANYYVNPETVRFYYEIIKISENDFIKVLIFATNFILNIKKMFLLKN